MTPIRVRDLTPDDEGSAVVLILRDGTRVEGVLVTAELDRPSAFARPDKCWPLIRDTTGRARAFGLPRDHPIEVAR